MAFLFRNKTNSPPQLAKHLSESLQKLLAEEQPSQKANELCANYLSQMKILMQGTPEIQVEPEQVFQCIQALVQENLIRTLARNIHRLPFEARKDTQFIFGTAFRYKHPGSVTPEPDVLRFILEQQPDVIIALCNGYMHRESASPCGSILREALKHEAVAHLILYDGQAEDERMLNLSSEVTSEPAKRNGVFWRFFDWIDKSAFEISSDAFNTFRDILTKHRDLVLEFLDLNFDDFFRTYHYKLIASDNYVTKRQSIKLLGEILLERAYYKIMSRYVAEPEHLKIIMNLMRDKAGMIKFESFHVFKIFVANPKKSVGVQKILILNRQALLKYLTTFCEDKNEDVQFTDEKGYLIQQLRNMPERPVPPPTPAPSAAPAAPAPQAVQR
ncbi:Mo25-like protein [Rhizodiscina lignyota]|uniref:Mo25-like protein n=1 Tax=Rhizodiscina lignyota TaxID=1504668 RepID=A0A9P4III7_9PEZI|nr:Mo25-like protein [Rhizodiscina lignyota]